MLDGRRGLRFLHAGVFALVVFSGSCVPLVLPLHAAAASISGVGGSLLPPVATKAPSSVAKAELTTSTGETFVDLWLYETGLPNGTVWPAWVEGPGMWGAGATNQSSTFFSFGPANGTWQWGVGEVPGFVPYPASGVFAASLNRTVIQITFLPVGNGRCSLLIAENGLPLGTTWWAIVNSFGFYSNGTQLYAVTGCSGAFVEFGSTSSLVPDPPNESVEYLTPEGIGLGVDFLRPSPTSPSNLGLTVLLAAGGAGVAVGLGFIAGRRSASRPH